MNFHVSAHPELLRSLKALVQIFGFVGSLGAAQKFYKWYANFWSKPMIIAGRPMELQSSSEAIHIGYERGKSLHKTGATKPENLKASIENHRGEYYRSPHYKFWVKGFTAGFLGELKPPTSTE